MNFKSRKTGSARLLLICVTISAYLSNAAVRANDGTTTPSWKLVDVGAKAASDRYQVDFGSIQLQSNASQFFSMNDLPEVSFTLGLVLPITHPFDQKQENKQGKEKQQTPANAKSPKTPSPSPKDSHDEANATGGSQADWLSDTIVSLKLIDTTTQQIVFRANQPLSEWTWTNWGPTSGTSFLYCRDGVSSRFRAKKGSEYRVEFKVIQVGQSNSPTRVRLFMSGGGWKSEPGSGQPPASFRLLRWLGI